MLPLHLSWEIGKIFRKIDVRKAFLLLLLYMRDLPMADVFRYETFGKIDIGP